MELRGLPATRAEAVRVGSKHYFTNVICKNGHLAARYTVSTKCCECKRTYGVKYQKDHAEERLEKSNEWRRKNITRVNELRRLRRKRNQEETRAKDKAWKDKHAERLRAKARAKYAKDLEASRARNKQKRESNPEGYRAAVMRWLSKNREKARANAKSWRLNNPEKAADNGRRRRARQFKAEGFHTADDVKRIGDKQKWKCHWCKTKTKTKYHVDHIIPLSKGGSDWPSNLAISCPSCNVRKHASDPIVFAQREGVLL
jgi:5-methylcytosine-specific restriction endonuclease McrA